MKNTAVTDMTVNPPYISQNVWRPFFDKMQRVKTPADLTVPTLKEYGLGGGQGPALQSGLKFLGLIDSEAKPTDRFKSIQVSGDQFKSNLGDIINKAYADLIDKHPLEHAAYEEIVNYFKGKYSVASATKMAKSFAVLCQMAGIESPAFSKMRSLDSEAVKGPALKRDRVVPDRASQTSKNRQPNIERLMPDEDLVKEFIKTNPMPTGMQWDAATLKVFFEEYRRTLKMLSGASKDNDPEVSP